VIASAVEADSILTLARKTHVAPSRAGVQVAVPRRNVAILVTVKEVEAVFGLVS